MKRRLRIVIPIVLVAGALTWWGLHRNGFLYAGTVEADEVDLSPGVAARIASYDVKEGDRVKKGQVLVRLAGEDVRLAAEEAESEYQRAKALFEAGSMPKAQFDRVKYTREDASVRRAWLTITAPSDGTVLSTYHLAGEWARPGMNLLTIADLTSLYAIVFVPQPMLARLAYGQKITGRLPELAGKSFPGWIAHIREEAEFTPKNVQTESERSRLVYGIKVRLDNPDGTLKPGMTVEVDLTPPPVGAAAAPASRP